MKKDTLNPLMIRGLRKSPQYRAVMTDLFMKGKLSAAEAADLIGTAPPEAVFGEPAASETGGSGGTAAGGVQIDDSKASLLKVWSSSKTQREIGAASEAVKAGADEAKAEAGEAKAMAGEAKAEAEAAAAAAPGAHVNKQLPLASGFSAAAKYTGYMKWGRVVCVDLFFGALQGVTAGQNASLFPAGSFPKPHTAGDKLSAPVLTESGEFVGMFYITSTGLGQLNMKVSPATLGIRAQVTYLSEEA